MLRLPVTVAHEDQRGTITDLLVEPLDSATLVTTKKGAVRGNHYHAHTFQWMYVIHGKLRVVTLDWMNGTTEVIAATTVEPGDLAVSPPMEAHAWEALEDTTVLVLTRGPRSGENYESDTIRLKQPLIRKVVPKEGRGR